jgi:hypothetical protein
MITIAIFGAGGKMGTRASVRLQGDPEFRVLHVEPSAAGQERPRKRGIAAAPPAGVPTRFSNNGRRPSRRSQRRSPKKWPGRGKASTTCVP